MSTDDRSGESVEVYFTFTHRLSPASLRGAGHFLCELSAICDGPLGVGDEGALGQLPPVREEDLPYRSGVGNTRATESGNALHGRTALDEVHGDRFPLAGNRQRGRLTRERRKLIKMRPRGVSNVDARQGSVPKLE